MKSSKNFSRLKLLIFFGLFSGFLASCEDQPIEGPIGSGGAQGIESLQASEFFDWKTTEQVRVLVSGLSADVAISRTLILQTENGREFYAGLQHMGSDFEMVFDLPAHVREVTMLYGNIEKKAEIADNQVSFDFIVDMGDEDIQP
ncbi:hypothetical protein SAMN04488057_101303 [Cyclobacterium lianum]|uniref:Uncharacterized protein n=1 Tax=Cyclobacterium lianum TaxID=388280 RepID=A0A1M7IF26_9BACT|nr:hypothetical protein [Cyclobacterium lianum]SHM39275.1 hypothetical protein SAMN04488057_101303 [Cyclobacterium lianum]